MFKTTLFATALLSITAVAEAADAPDTSTWVRCSSFAYNGKTATTPKPGEYLNPIVAGFYPDPSFFFDDDGKCYVLNCDEPVGQAKYSGHRTIRIQEVNLEQKQPVGEKTVLVDGGTDISKRPNCAAGLAAFQNEGHYYAINAKIDSGHLTEISLEQPVGGGGFGRGGGRRGGPPNFLATQKLPENLASIDLRIEGAGPVTKCSYKIGNGGFTQLGQDLPSSFLSTDTAGGFQGVTLGMFARLNSTNSVSQSTSQ